MLIKFNIFLLLLATVYKIAINKWIKYPMFSQSEDFSLDIIVRWKEKIVKGKMEHCRLKKFNVIFMFAKLIITLSRLKKNGTCQRGGFSLSISGNSYIFAFKPCRIW